MPEEGWVAMALADDGDAAAGVPDAEPLDLSGDKERRVGQEVDSRLDRKQQQDGELVQPVEVVGDNDVVAGPRNVLPPRDVEAEYEVQQRDPDEPHQPVGKSRLAPHRKQVRRRERGLWHKLARV